MGNQSWLTGAPRNKHWLGRTEMLASKLVLMEQTRENLISDGNLDPESEALSIGVQSWLTGAATHKHYLGFTQMLVSKLVLKKQTRKHFITQRW